MNYNPGMMLWLWLLIAPLLAMVFLGNAGSPTSRYDEMPRRDEGDRIRRD